MSAAVTSPVPSYTLHILPADEGRAFPVNFRMPLGFPQRNFPSAISYVPTADDLIVATYPKCGTTWTQHLIFMLLHCRPLGPGERLAEKFPHLEEVGGDAAGSLPMTPASSGRLGRRTIKTHFPFGLVNFVGDCTKYVVVLRNPKDCCVSFYHHTVGFTKHYDFADGSFETYADCFIKGEVDFGDYFCFVRSWIDGCRDRGNVLLLTYEKMVADRRGAVLALAGFLGGETYCSDLLGPKSENFLQEILEATSIKDMQKDPLRWCSERPAEKPFIRKGAVGDWRNYFGKEQSDLMDQRIRECFSEKEMKEIWGDEYARILF